MRIDDEIIKLYKDLIEVKIDENYKEIQLKKDFFQKNLVNGELYKFISFNNEESLNNSKLNSLRENVLWYAAHHTLIENDPSEFSIRCNIDRVCRKTHYNKETLRNLLECLRELYDVCCLTSGCSEIMWKKYANNYSGICCVFKIIDYSNITPVIYCDKSKVDFTSYLIKTIKNSKSQKPYRVLSLIAPVLKDKKCYSYEWEMRLLNGDVYDNPYGKLGGKVCAFKKKAIGYKGTTYSYETSGLELKKIIIGENTDFSIIRKIEEICRKKNIEIENR